jgi:hypothetical protein
MTKPTAAKAADKKTELLGASKPVAKPNPHVDNVLRYQKEVRVFPIFL